MSYPDFISDREGLERWREHARQGPGHDMAQANKNTLYRFVQTIDNLEAALSAAEAARDEAIKLMTQYAREAGEAKGRLEGSEAAGAVDGWRERAEAAEARERVKDEALKPFAKAGEGLQFVRDRWIRTNAFGGREVVHEITFTDLEPFAEAARALTPETPHAE